MAALEDEIIRRRLLYEGDSGVDERRILNLLKAFFKWAKLDVNHPDREAMYNKMMIISYMIEGNAEKLQAICDMNKEQQEFYERLSTEIDSNLAVASTEIEQLKVDLQDAKRIKRNRQEYDALVDIIMRNPSRLETSEKIQSVTAEVEALAATRELVDRQVEERRRQFALLLLAAQNLKDQLENESDTNTPQGS